MVGATQQNPNISIDYQIPPALRALARRTMNNSNKPRAGSDEEDFSLELDKSVVILTAKLSANYRSLKITIVVWEVLLRL